MSKYEDKVSAPKVYLKKVRGVALRVQMGALLLDERFPGWANQVDTRNLEIRNCRDCILGQLYGEYFHGVRQLGLVEGHSYGFAPSPHQYPFARNLHNAWKQEIMARR